MLDFNLMPQHEIDRYIEMEKFKHEPFFKAGSFYFMIVINNEDRAVLAVKQLSKVSCEAHVRVHAEKKHQTITPRRFKKTLDFLNQQLGFKILFVFTHLKSMKKLCQRFKMNVLSENNEHYILRKEFDHG
jgi:hypothetical protein